MTAAVEDVIFSDPAIRAHYETSRPGDLPDFVRGTLYLNGPARFTIGATTRRHWLDGEGLARALELGVDRVSYRAAYVGTRRFVDETEAQQPLYRSFGWAAPGDRLRGKILLETPANVSLYPFGGQLLAFGEQALPWLLDSRTLATLGECDFSGKFGALQPFTAHPKLDRASGRLCGFGIAYLGKIAKLSYHEIDTRLQEVARGSCVLSGANYVHDFALSQHYAIFHLGPYRVDIRRFMAGEHLQAAMTWEDGPSSLRVIDRASGREFADVPLPRTSFCLHTINAWEDETGLTVDLVDTPRPFFDQYVADPHMFGDLQPCAAVRYRLDPTNWRLIDTTVAEYGLHYDFPNTGSHCVQRAYDHFWAAAMPATPAPTPKFYNRLLRFDWKTASYADHWECPPHWVLGGEPTVVANPADHSQVAVLTQAYDLASKHSSYLCFDGHHLARGPVTVVPLPFFDPLGFHTSFQPDKYTVTEP